MYLILGVLGIYVLDLIIRLIDLVHLKCWPSTVYLTLLTLFSIHSACLHWHPVWAASEGPQAPYIKCSVNRTKPHNAISCERSAAAVGTPTVQLPWITLWSCLHPAKVIPTILQMAIPERREAILKCVELSWRPCLPLHRFLWSLVFIHRQPAGSLV